MELMSVNGLGIIKEHNKLRCNEVYINLTIYYQHKHKEDENKMFPLAVHCMCNYVLKEVMLPVIASPLLYTNKKILLQNKSTLHCKYGLQIASLWDVNCTCA